MRYLNGSPTDNNATLFKEGYAAALEAAGFTPTADQAVPDWDNTKAGTIFEQMYTEANGDFVAVAAANDGLGGAAIAVLDRNGQAGKIFVTGQDATDEGLQRVLLGTQCMTVYKAVKQEADAAAALAVALLNGDTAAADALATGVTADSEAGTEVPSVLLVPQAIYAENVRTSSLTASRRSRRSAQPTRSRPSAPSSASSRNPHPALAGPYDSGGGGWFIRPHRRTTTHLRNPLPAHVRCEKVTP